MATRLIIVGAGGHGKAVAEIVAMCDRFELVGFVDDAWPDISAVWQHPVLGDFDSLASLRAVAEQVVVAIGNNRLRRTLQERAKEMGFSAATIVHPRAIVASSSRIGNGVAIMAGAIVGCEAVVGDGAIINAGAVLDHHALLADYAHLGVGVVAAGGVRIQEGAWLQAGCSAGYGVEVSPWSVMQPGSALS